MSDCNGGCDQCKSGPASDKGPGENLAESIHHDCCWFAREGKVEICQKRNIKFIYDIHGNLSESCRDCEHYSYYQH